MTIKINSLSVLGCIFALLTLSAEAEPPFAKKTVRNYFTSVYGEGCESTEFRYSCLGVTALENYDNHGNYENTFVGTFEYGYEFDPDTGISLEFYRNLDCAQPREAVWASRKSVTVEASLDPGALSCSSWGYLYIFDPSSGEPQYLPYAFENVIDVSGFWKDPLFGSSGNFNWRNHSYDAVSDRIVQWTVQCRESNGQTMRTGGINVDGHFVPFIGEIYSAGYSSFTIQTCNDQNSPYR